MKVYPLFGNGMASHSYPVTRQRRVNVYFENRPDGDKTKVAVFGTPGLSVLKETYGPCRGLMGTESKLFTVAGQVLYVYNSAGTITDSESLNSSIGNVSMTRDSDQVLIVDGVNGYVYKPSSGAFTQIVSAGFPNGTRTCTFVSSYFVCEQPETQKFWVSDTFDAQTWSALSFASASQYTDNIMAVDGLIGNLVLFSERHIEFWQNVGSSPQPFAPILSATSEYGINAIWSRAHAGSTILFLAQNPQGTSQVCQISGYSVSVVSTPDLEDVINGFATVSDAVALSYVINGHPMYQLTFPTANRSFLYDLSTGIWSEVQSGVSVTYAQRHRAQFSTTWKNQTIASDFANGYLYTFDENTYTDAGTTVIRELVTRHGSQDYNVISVAELYLDMETGVGTNVTTGYNAATPNPVITVECSKDNGRTWNNPRLLQLGAQGKYLTRVIARRFGSARDFVFRFRMTDPVKFVLTEGAAVVAERQQ